MAFRLDTWATAFPSTPVLRGVLAYRQTPVEDDTLIAVISVAAQVKPRLPAVAGAGGQQIDVPRSREAAADRV